ncbi:MFS transporter [Sulfuracidifex tepidarius]|uniref:Multidrug resistance protein MdtD n=1 Tax=Sulfuracidifex tepidarius TaxID=1294262 RepID=A0A510E564_9CREN|nr:MFS transporter [Sulfuracidifex tepidarius]BBG27619.1 Putative multidrug resistance protein MdtD [Sulfuracidifex tepidarius]
MRERLILLVLVLGTMMSAVDSTVVILALPTITQDLHTTLTLTIWTILSYLLVIAVMTTQLGRLGDSIGRARIYNTGFLLFTVGSLLCGMSPSIFFLIGSRVLQAVGASMIQANSGAIIADMFSPNRRGKAYGFTSIGWNVGATLGIVIGGVLTTLVGWRYIFFINLPIGAVAFTLGLKYINYEGKKEKKPLDVIGTLGLGIGLVMVSLSGSEIAALGVNLLDLLTVGAGIVVLAMTLNQERKISFPIVNMKAFKNRTLSFSILASFFQSMGYLAVVFIVIMYLQGIRGLSPLDSSLLLIPGYVIASSLGPFMGILSDRVGGRVPATLGILMMMSAVGVYFTLTPSSSYYTVIAASVLGGIGSSMFYPANNSSVMANASMGDYGGVSGLLRTLANMGTLSSYVMTIAVASIAVPRQVAFEVFLGTANLLGGVSSAFMTGVRTDLLVSAGILSVALVLSALRGKEVRESKREKVQTYSQK